MPVDTVRLVLLQIYYVSETEKECNIDIVRMGPATGES